MAPPRVRRSEGLRLSITVLRRGIATIHRGQAVLLSRVLSGISSLSEPCVT